MSLKRVALACLAAGILAACGGSTDGPTATDLVVTPNPVALASINQTQQLTAVVNDQNGAPMSGVTTTYASNASGTASVSATGLVTAHAVGTATITVTAAGLTENVAVTVAQTPTAVTKTGGDAQQGIESTQLATAIKVKVADALGTGIPGVSVAFAAQNGGSVSAATGKTDAAGEAQVTWTLGAGAGAQTATATVTGVTAATFNATSLAAGPAAIAKVSGDAQTGVESVQLSNPIKVKVTDALGAALSGVDVAFAAQNGGSVSAATVATNAAGEAQVTWTLGAGTGAQTATAEVTGLTLVTFTATAQSATTLVIQKHVGDAQTALVGYATNIRPAVRIANLADQPQAGVNVTFAVTGGGGSIPGSTTIATNADGIAQVENWVVGGSAGANTMSATGAGTYSGANNVSFAATGATAQYNIEIRNIGPALSAEAQAALTAAEVYWEQIIYGELSNITINTSSACGIAGATINETVDDLIILARFDSIDGPSGTLGQAGACSIRVSNGLPIYGFMVFDSADVTLMNTNGILNSVMLHEMGHILGFSDGIWNSNPAVTNPVTCAVNVPRDAGGAGTVGLDSYFQCAGTRAAFDSIGGGSFTGGSRVPLENCTGLGGTPCSTTGTIYAHWRETTFDEELMTGYVCAGGSCPMSIVTIASFGDIGYTVNYDAAQAYSQVFSVRAAAGGARIPLGNDVLRIPIEVVDQGGRVVRVIRP